MAYDSLESYVQLCCEEEICEAIESFLNENGYVCTDDPYASHSFLDNYNEIYCLTHESLFTEIDNLDVKAIRCKKLNKDDLIEISKTTYFTPLNSTMDDYTYVENENELLIYDPFQGEANIDNLISLEIKLSVDIVYSKEDQNYDEIEVSRNNRRFIVTLLAELLDNLKIVAEINTEEIYEADFKPVSITDTYFLPDISSDNLEEVAAYIYRKHFSHFYLENAKFPYEEFIKKLGLKQRNVDFKDKNIFGRMYFKSAVINDIFNIDGYDDLSKPIFIEKGTMLISNSHYFMEDYGSLYNTIAHELIHWILHKDFFGILCLLVDEPSQLSCEIIPKVPDDNMTGIEKAIWWAEWQANNLATRIMMPKEWFITALARQCYEASTYFTEEGRVLEAALFETAKTFGVSMYDAKVRAMQLGISEAEGTFLRKKDIFYEPITFIRTSLQKNQTFIIDKASYIKLLDTNREFAALIHHREYVYAECVVVQNKPKYVKRTSSPQLEYALTEYARNHADECCMKFEKQYLDDGIHHFEFYGQCYLSKELTDKILLKIGLSEDEITEHKKGRNEQGIIAKLACEGDSLMSTMRKLPNSFSGTLDHYMKNGTFNENKEISNHDLSELTGLSEDYIRKIRKEENHNISLRTTCAICMGLHLPPLFSRDLLRKARVDFPYTKQGYMQRVLLEEYFTESLGVVDEILQKNGLARWTYDKSEKKQKKMKS